jgi:hypothetical protein
VGSSSKTRSEARITKVSQTNIDELLLELFGDDVKFCPRWLETMASSRRPMRP